ncbi:MAG TPA: DUF5655 domain-containing protein [Frankiaceae bacterium]|nr:DUF5655 domain-containing protein [Frankiaceae bacterium]
MVETRDWRDMRDWMAALLERRGEGGVAEWNARIAAANPADEPAVRAWLTDHGVTGYAQMLLVFERFGYPDFFTASADELVDAQYADRPALRPVYDRVVLAAHSVGEVAVQARKTYVSLLTPRRTFAIVKATTRTRVDLGLRRDGADSGGNLLGAKGLGNDTINVRVALTVPDDVDDEVVALLRRAYDASA